MKILWLQVTKKIAYYNSEFGMDMTVRDEEGNTIDPSAVSAVSLFR